MNLERIKNIKEDIEYELEYFNLKFQDIEIDEISEGKSKVKFVAEMGLDDHSISEYFKGMMRDIRRSMLFDGMREFYEDMLEDIKEGVGGCKSDLNDSVEDCDLAIKKIEDTQKKLDNFLEEFTRYKKSGIGNGFRN